MNYETAENEIVDRITGKFAELNLSQVFLACLFPDNDKDAEAFKSKLAKPTVAVIHADSTFENGSSLGCVRQDETARFRCTFYGKKMRGVSGLNTMLQHVKNFLLGFRLSDSEPLTISAFGKEKDEDGFWMPWLEFECRTTNVQVVEYADDVQGQNLTHTDTIDQFL